MRWSNKGHEYDAEYENIEKLSRIYLFGAGHDGAMVKQILSERYIGAAIEGFIDNDVRKQGTKYLGLSVYALEDVERDVRTGIVVAFASEFTEKIDAQLMGQAWIKGVNFFHYEEFISVIAAYRYNELFIPSISFLPTTKCNLRCKACLNFTTYIKRFTERPLEELKADIDLFFRTVDYVGLLFISGGEPLLYSAVAQLVRYIDETYGNKIYSLETVTNGTVAPSEEFLMALRDTRLKITVDDYREALPEHKEKIEENLRKMQEAAGENKVIPRTYTEWVDLYPYPQKSMNEEELAQKYDRCHVPWQEYRNGKLYTCNYAAFASVAGLTGQPDKTETYDFHAHKREDLKKAMEFRLGFSEKGYAEFCRECAGYLEINEHKVKPALQG
ncbi:MAG: radical SAM protein [Roseburia sp.]|nr:radical SAM protein [Roseburia sp.]